MKILTNKDRDKAIRAVARMYGKADECFHKMVELQLFDVGEMYDSLGICHSAMQMVVDIIGGFDIMCDELDKWAEEQAHKE